MAQSKKSPPQAGGVSVVRKADGAYVIDGASERRLTNRFKAVTLRDAPAKPTHLTEAEILAATLRLKAAA